MSLSAPLSLPLSLSHALSLSLSLAHSLHWLGRERERGERGKWGLLYNKTPPSSCLVSLSLQLSLSFSLRLPLAIFVSLSRLNDTLSLWLTVWLEIGRAHV